jgi:hypothetical protein
MSRSSYVCFRAGFIGLGLSVALVLAGCGTNVPGLLAKDSDLQWEADELLAGVEDMNLGLEKDFNRAELEKTVACKDLYKAVELRVIRELHEGPLPFGAKFVYDAKLLMALLIPLGKVERCRAAIETYRQEYEELQAVVPAHVGDP